MKKLLAVILILVCTVSLIGCSEKSDNDTAATSNYVSSDDITTHTHVFSEATCTSRKVCTICGEESGYALGHSYSGKYCVRCGASNPDYTAPSYSAPQSTHTHYYTSSVTKNPTCGSEGIRTYKCSCGSSYTEAIAKSSSHDWEYATCTAPDTCKTCGTTRGSAKGHNYGTYDGKCYRCGKIDPAVTVALSSCSLELPSLPKTVSEYGYKNSLQSSVKVTNITYKFEPYSDGKVTLVCYFSGEKTYDYRGAGQSDGCKISWKLYDSNGNVFRTGTFYSPSVAMGESFSNQEEDLIYNFEASSPGAYKLVILDTN